MTRCLPSIVFALLFAAAAATGCAHASHQTWTKAGAGPQDLARDRYACTQESRVPWGGSYGGGSASPGGGSAAWGSAGSVAQGGSDGGFIFLGVHRRAQTEANRLFDACMEARGWQGYEGVPGGSVASAPPAPGASQPSPPSGGISG